MKDGEGNVLKMSFAGCKRKITYNENLTTWQWVSSHLQSGNSLKKLLAAAGPLKAV
jgi:hypothetical protein